MSHHLRLEPKEEPPSLHGRAMDNLRFIRETMQQASSFTAVSGWAMVAVGATACGTVAVTQWQGWQLGQDRETEWWVAVWMAQAVLSLLIAGTAMHRKARRSDAGLLTGPGRKMALSFSPPMFVGAVLTLVLYRAGLATILPGMWLLLYGTGVVTGGAFSVPSIPVMGCCFMLTGTLALLCSWTLGNIFMAIGFGALHIIFGLHIARRHGG